MVELLKGVACYDGTWYNLHHCLVLHDRVCQAVTGAAGARCGFMSAERTGRCKVLANMPAPG